jgi:probable F420-dependent oxidoreductase
VKVRVGFGLGAVAVDAGSFEAIVDGLEARGFDSLWLSERVTGPGPDPMTALAVAAGRTRKLKLGTSVLVLPGRNPVLLAKQMATLDRLSGGRFLPAVGLGAVQSGEQEAFGVDRAERAGLLDEALPLMRRLWTEDEVDHEGHHFRLHKLTVQPRPLSAPLDVWLGGRAPSELRRVGRLGDGWLPSFCTPDEAAEGRAQVERSAAQAGRSIDPEHWGVLVAYLADGPMPDALRERLAKRLSRPVEEVIPGAVSELRERLEAFVDVGFTKFVVSPIGPAPSPDLIDRRLVELTEAVLPMQGSRA